MIKDFTNYMLVVGIRSPKNSTVVDMNGYTETVFVLTHLPEARDK